MKLYIASIGFAFLACQPAPQDHTPPQDEILISSDSEMTSVPVLDTPEAPVSPKSTPETGETAPAVEHARTASEASSSDPNLDLESSQPTPVPQTSPLPQPNEQELSSGPDEPGVQPSAESLPLGISHSTWNRLVSTYVSPAGKVNYKGFISEKQTLQSYLDLLAQNPPAASWSQSEILAYWINTYNAFTVKLITDHYPLNSIMDLEKPWDNPFIKIGTKQYSLNQIEHEIIRKQFQEPRIHFAVNCASISCPKLLNQAYTAEKLEGQLTAQTQAYIHNPNENSITPDKVELSSLFDWYKEDFTRSGSLIDFLNSYSKTQIKSNAQISFKDYNWSLNE